MTNVVSLILIGGIIISLLSMIFATYLPAWGKDMEVQTLNGVMDSFMDIKSNIDTLSVGGDIGTSMSTKIALGSSGGPMFGFGRMSGSLELREESGLMEISDQTGTVYGQGRGVLHYSSSTIHVSDQDIYLESGALVKDEGINPVLKGPPNVVLEYDVNTGELSLYVMVLTLEGDEVSFSGTGTYMVKTALMSETVNTYEIDPATTQVQLSVTTEHGSVWSDLFGDITSSEGLTEGAGNDYTIAQGTDASGNPNVTLTLLTLNELVVRSSVIDLRMA